MAPATTAAAAAVQPISELRRLWLAAAEAADALRRAESRQDEPGFSIGRFEDAAERAENDLRDYLLIEHGLTTADLKRSVL